MLEQKNKEQEALFGKYSIILPKFNKATKENSANKSTDVTLADVTNIKFPTEKAVKTYVDGSSAANAAALNVEINNRTNADTTLQSNINSLTTTVTANATTAANADTALQSNINNLRKSNHNNIFKFFINI